MGCDLAVSPARTKDHRRICAKPGRFYQVTKGSGSLVLFSCRNHSRRLERLGFEIREVTPLEASAYRKLREQEIEDDQIRASHCAGELAAIAESRRRP